MSTTAVAPNARRPSAAAEERPSLGRLTKIELRKMTDTRAGFWLMLGVFAITVLVVVLSCVLGDASDHNMRDVMDNAVQPAGILLPVVGILLYTSEFTQRTSLATFALVPRRLTVIAAKVCACIALSVIALFVCRALSTIGVLATGAKLSDAWVLPGWMFMQTFAYVVTAMITGVAFGAALRTTAPAIVGYFVLPIALSFASALSFMKDPTRWLDATQSLSPLTEHALSGVGWGRAVTTLAVWMVLPLAIGAWRLMREEIS